MKTIDAIHVLENWGNLEKVVFTTNDLHKLFPMENRRCFIERLRRLVREKFLIQVGRGIYLNTFAHYAHSTLIEHIAKAFRRGFFNYISLESMLSEYGVISQIPIDRLTVMTTGREGLFHTPYGSIEFTHTSRPVRDIINQIQYIPGRPLRVATKEIAWRDLKRVGRNLDLVDMEALNAD